MSGPAVKIQHGEIVRKVTLPSSLEWAGVSSLVRDRFQLGEEARFVLTYKDQDGDLIAVSSDLELSEMISASGPPYRLTIKLLGQPTKPKPAPALAPLESVITAGSPPVDSSSANKAIEAGDEVPELISAGSDDGMPALEAVQGESDVENDDDMPSLEAAFSTEVDELEDGDGMPELEQVGLVAEEGSSASDDESVPQLEPVSPGLAESAVWVEVDGAKAELYSSPSVSTTQDLNETAAEAELYVDDALAEASPFDDPDDAEVNPDDAPPVHSTSFADPDDDTGAPTPAIDRTESSGPGSFPLPPSIATFLSALPQRADSLSSHLSSLLSEGNTAPLRSLFTTAPQSVEELPVLARTFAGELNNLLGTALSGVRNEANQLRDEFEALKVNIAKDKKDLEDRLRKEWDDAVASERAKRGYSQDQAEDEQKDDAEEAKQEAAEEKGEDAAEDAAEAAEVNEKGLPMDPASRAARKQQRHEARLARKALRQAEKREAKRAARAVKAASVPETASTSAAPSVETPAGESTASAPTPYNPFDDFTAELAPSEISEVASTLTRVSTPRSLIGAYPVLPSFPVAPAQPLYPTSDDFFNRRVGASRNSMPGAFNPSASVSTQPAVDRNASTGYFVGNSALSRSNTMPAPATAPTMPGAFAGGPAGDGSDNLFAGFVNRSATPTAPAGHGAWAEVTPEQVKEAVGRLGFDLKDLGVRIAAERAWEEKRGKTLGEMVAHCVDKLV